MATFTQIALGDQNFSTLVDVLLFIDDTLEDSALVQTLDTASLDLTVFAPTNAAFGQLAADIGFAGDTGDASAVSAFLTENVPVDLLNTVILYHVAGGAQSAADIAEAGSVTTLQGGDIGAGELPTLTDLEPDLINPSLVTTDIPADNGILHVIDRVLLPADLPDNDAPTLTGLVAASGTNFDSNPGDFDILLKAVQTAGLADVLDSGDLDLTVFAPTDAAFLNLARELGFEGSSEGQAWNYLVKALTILGNGDPIPVLEQVLLYHVAGESLQASQVLSRDEIETLQGGALGVEGTSLVDADLDTANPNLIATDIQASNGIAHVIDNVLLPLDLPFAGTSPDDLRIGTGQLETFSTGAGDDVISGEGGNDTVNAGSGNDTVLAGSGNDTVHGGSGDDTIDGGSGNDTIRAGAGDDTVQGGDGRDDIRGSNGDDMLDGGRSHDDIRGDAGDDMLIGEHGRDTLNGGSGNDTLDGGTQNDVLKGGGGQDTFIFADGYGRDTILDFRNGVDKIDLSAFDLDRLQDLDIRDTDNGAQIRFDGGDRLVLNRVEAAELDSLDFIF